MAAGTWESYHAITALMYRYAECIDAADFAGIAEVFEHAAMTNEGTDDEIRGGEAISRLYQRTNRVHDDGTLRTRHLTGNVFVDIDETADAATARSSFVVFQQTASLPLQPIVSGRYRDRFERVDGAWRFAQRHMIVDHIGDVREHLAFDISAYQPQPAAEQSK